MTTDPLWAQLEAKGLTRPKYPDPNRPRDPGPALNDDEALQLATNAGVGAGGLRRDGTTEPARGAAGGRVRCPSGGRGGRGPVDGAWRHPAGPEAQHRRWWGAPDGSIRARLEALAAGRDQAHTAVAAAEARIRAWWQRRTPEQRAADWAVEHRLAAIEKEHQP